MPSEFLFDLLKSMTPGEKRYFKKKARGGQGRTGENYLELYDILDRSTTYDEESVKIAHSNPVYAANLSFGKNHLYNILLDTLSDYHAKSGNAQLEVARYWSKLQILLEKGLNKQAFKLIGQAKRHCQIYHLGFDHLKFLHTERNLISRFETKGARKKLDALVAVCEELHSHLSMEMQIITLYERYFLAHRTEKPEKRKAAMDKFEAFCRENEHYFSGNPSFHSLVFFNFTRAMNFEIEQNYRMHKFHVGKILELYDRDERVRAANLERYLNMLANYLGSSLLVEETTREDFQRLFERMEQIRTDSPKLQVRLLHNSLYFKLLVDLRFRQFVQASRLDKAIFEFLAKYSGNLALDRVLTYKYHMGVAHFGAAMEDPAEKEEHLSGAIRWFLEIENQSKFETKSTLRSFTRLYFILAHFDLGAEEFVGNRIRAYLTYLKKEKKTGSIEHTILSGIKKVVSSKTPEQRLKHMETIAEKIPQTQQFELLVDWVNEKVNAFRKLV
ncbi:MAG: hypothetical protein H6563_13840 [Lewinellaceae bacterium]|nr:hypothetical protein [Lewinellaceae bacterium]